jgi:hypothetical protein
MRVVPFPIHPAASHPVSTARQLYLMRLPVDGRIVIQQLQRIEQIE